MIFNDDNELATYIRKRAINKTRFKLEIAKRRAVMKGTDLSKLSDEDWGIIQTKTFKKSLEEVGEIIKEEFRNGVHSFINLSLTEVEKDQKVDQGIVIAEHCKSKKLDGKN